MEDTQPQPEPFNRNAVVSLVAALLTIVFLCTGVAPIPLTGFVCFPATIFSGALAVVFGIASLAQIRSRRERGREMALAGIAIGGPAAMAAICLVSAGIVLIPRIAAFVRQWLHW